MIWPDLTSRSRKVPSAGAERIGAIVWPQSGHRPPLSSLNRRSWGSTDSQCQAKHCQVSAARSVGWLYSADESGLFCQPASASRWKSPAIGVYGMSCGRLRAAIDTGCIWKPPAVDAYGYVLPPACCSCHVSPPQDAF